MVTAAVESGMGREVADGTDTAVPPVGTREREGRADQCACWVGLPELGRCAKGGAGRERADAEERPQAREQAHRSKAREREKQASGEET